VETLGSQIGFDESLRAQVATLTNLQSTNALINTQLTASQDALNNISSDAQTFMSALMTAQSTGSIGGLAIQARAFLDSFTNYANTTSGGVYLFGGTNNSVAPMASYSGDPLPGSTVNPQTATDDTFNSAFPSTPVNSISASGIDSFLSGPFATLFADLASGSPSTTPSWATWSQGADTDTSAIISPGHSITTSVSTYGTAFRQIASAYTSIAGLDINDMNSSAQQAVISYAVQQISQGMSSIGDMTTTLGLSQSQITAANKALLTQTTTINNTIGQLDNADPYKTAETINTLTTQLETAYSLTNRISKLSLVNYL
jgi:flagellar hook-associated protein 3 FlgL